VPLEQQVLQVQLDQQVFRAFKERPALVQRVLRVQQAHRERQVSQEQPVLEQQG
jgi:hypothetical protein